MRHHSPKRFVFTAVAAVAVVGAALLPGIASADGSPPRNGVPSVNIHGTTTYGDAGEQTYGVGRPGPKRAPSVSGDFNNDGVVDAADYVIWRR